MKTVADRLNILNTCNVGLTDILETVLRSPNVCSSDSCLTGIRYNDILNIKASFPALKNIFITSGGRGPVANLNGNNKSVATWFKDAVSNYVTTGFNQAGFVKNITVNHIPFNLIYLYSPGNSANVALKGALDANNNFNIPGLTIGALRRLQWCYFLNNYHTKFDGEIDVTKYGHLVEYFESN